MTKDISAFPTYHGGYSKCDTEGSGMTLRDYFAAKAMQGILAAGRDAQYGDGSMMLLSNAAYRIADEMMEVRDNT